MPTYTFRAKKITGEETTGTRAAKDIRDLTISIREEGYMLIHAEEEGAGKKSLVSLKNILQKLGKVSLEDKMIFARNLSVMIRAGLSITKALEVLHKQSENPTFKKVILDLSEQVKNGISLSESTKRHQKVFSHIFTAMVQAGEVSGKLDESLSVLAIQMQNDYELRRKVKGALIYPGVIITVMISIGILMMVYVVPTLSSTFLELGIDLPASTKLIIAISNGLTTWGVTSVFLMPVIGYLFYLAMHTSRVKYIFDVIIMRLPVLGELFKKMNSARTARTMGSLIESGVPITQALNITQDVLQNHLYKNVLKEALKNIQKGSTISESFITHTDLYPVLVGEMIAVGEETGKTDEMLEELALFYEGEVAAATKDLSSIIEPVLMVIIGIVVGFFAISMIQPLYSSVSGGF
ncbi:MAG: hypothetical protein COU90_01355 [Candidatus Ryanbacteria bacterium CG10_big_fil_rev_8_21_14_0_10_43_42]|uniref:Type II secretion system protein GspF domain-containing protein n=1 Tax=Candidatus Ryanbacteria bacterium CG10_big_fil_rev_8_21_14_0_10_43_42 TaxID=1974864 RepID=A0A2M8KXM4_9BACT|nr:MAG: hypothetical protein COU90_01355 [Candidatus Ryanbacteria bacterium CG10_big_fil_rev_8_21_14_0_10_43_42]